MVVVNKQVDYGLQLLLALAGLPEGEYMSIRTFAKERTISFLFLQKIVRKLKQAALVEALKGPAGGYRLAVMPETVTLKDVVEAIEGPYRFVSCLEQGKCPITEGCVSRNVFEVVHSDILESLSKYSLSTIGDMVQPRL